MAISNLLLTCQLVGPVRDPVHCRSKYYTPGAAGSVLLGTLETELDIVAAQDSRGVAAIAS
ncbi:hypothetical protein [Bradyrhizobium sp. USDA 4353]